MKIELEFSWRPFRISIGRAVPAAAAVRSALPPIDVAVLAVDAVTGDVMRGRTEDARLEMNRALAKAKLEPVKRDRKGTATAKATRRSKSDR